MIYTVLALAEKKRWYIHASNDNEVFGRWAAKPKTLQIVTIFDDCGEWVGSYNPTPKPIPIPPST